MPEINDEARIECVTAIVAAYVSHNALPVQAVPDLIADVNRSLGSLGKPSMALVADQLPAVPINMSITPDYLVCLEDGRRLKSLKRHLHSFGLTPEAYRARWGLPVDYPMVAPNYAATRSQLARDFGLGRRRPHLAAVS